MQNNTRKRTRGDDASHDENTTAALSTSLSSSTTSRALQPRSVNVIQNTPHGAHASPPLKRQMGAGTTSANKTSEKSVSHTGCTVRSGFRAPSSNYHSSGSSRRSTLSGVHSTGAEDQSPQQLQQARGRPQQSLCPFVLPSNSKHHSSSSPRPPSASSTATSAYTATGRAPRTFSDDKRGVSSRLVGKKQLPSGNTTAPPTSSSVAAAAPPHSPRSARTSLTDAETALRSVWQAKREMLEQEMRLLESHSTQLQEDTEAVEDAIEDMLIEFEEDKRRVEERHTGTVMRYATRMRQLRAREGASLATEQRAFDTIASSVRTVQQLQQRQETAQESIILAAEQFSSLQAQLADGRERAAQRDAALQQLQTEEERMKDASYGLSGEVRELVLEMERLKAERKKTEVAAMESEMKRRQLYSLCEEVKGSIRVYCRVKGTAVVDIGVTGGANHEKEAEQEGKTEAALDRGTTLGSPTATPSPQNASRGSSRDSSVSTTACSGATAATMTSTGMCCPLPRPAGGARSGRSTARSSVTAATMAVSEDRCTYGADCDGRLNPAEASEDADGGGAPLFTFPDGISPLDDLDMEEAEKGCEGTDEARAGLSTLCELKLLSPNSADSPLCEVADESQAAAGLPYRCGRSITIHQTRSNATSTGLNNTAESFTYDRVFSGAAQQAEVYRDVEPLVRNAVDGYRVCVFAYGQTGSGKTYTMEGALQENTNPAAFGVTPRALRTILQRQQELAAEGWTYELSCTFIEIYNDVIRDLFQSGSARYEQVMQQGGSAGNYHTIKHSADTTHITNVSEKAIHDMDEFFALYQRAVEQRSTAKTELNDKSSRSHCIFTLSITGTNATIRQRSEGILCLVDLAGSERVNESGVQGRQFKEAVNINRSLLDLGKCIRALRSGAVVPWRNCKLTYLLQNCLGAKGGKMLMIVTVSHLRQHAPESLHSLRFAARVQETVIGTSVKRVVSMS